MKASGADHSDWENDPLIVASDELARALRASVADAVVALERLYYFRSRRAAGVQYGDLVVEHAERSVVEILSESQERLAQAGSHFRRQTAKMLAAEGVSQADIARRFGVTRQRIAALLSDET